MTTLFLINSIVTGMLALIWSTRGVQNCLMKIALATLFIVNLICYLRGIGFIVKI